MTDEPIQEFDPRGLTHAIAVQRAVLRAQIKNIDTLIEATLESPIGQSGRVESTPIPDQVSSVLRMLMQAIGASSNTVRTLTDETSLQTRDAYSVARSVVELAVNACYLCAQGEPIAEKLIRHAQQKSYRDLTRRSKIGSQIIELTCSGLPDVPDAEMQGILDEFATADGGEKRSWTNKSIDDRIRIAGEKCGERVTSSLHWARFIVYRHSSDILHGTLFGCLYFFGMTIPNDPNKARDPEEIVGQHRMLVLMATSLSITAVVDAFHSIYGFAEAKQREKRAWELLAHHPYFGVAKSSA